ncbi:exonuclease SbcCD subunit D C-terminal domain-containing protein [Schaalia sp. 19OD2882]|uniref:exonuclease SbcCD subunit D n=1 Tax=Schaalia sp. 19OD2882 TaxID=2794089 RepID=UPI001C1F03E1|nr:exonuclease SbcCD subunit D C-terminal domain-containing protein [Schaalia sp. 19OD2882]QWW20318.1 exonuclease SbcCD subunit D C-terminal domain-containing protein [Schaalia sp. 19OD2882]
MRILHTADWHLGRTLHGEDLGPAHAAFLDHLVDLVSHHRVDVLVVSGDVFDRTLAPLASLRLLQGALERLCPMTRVILTPGNHDSATRLGFGASLMREELRVFSRVDQVGIPVEVPGPGGQDGLLVYPVPWLEPDLVRHELGEVGSPVARSHEAVLRAALARITADLQVRRSQGDARPALAMVHTFVSGAVESDSERDIQVGGVAAVPASLFEDTGLAYVACGHLHRPQDVKGTGTKVRYSGSPLPLSFSEAGDHKSVTLVDISPDGAVDVQVLELPVWRRLAVLEGTMEHLLSPATDTHLQDWVSLRVTDPARPSEMVRRLRERFAHALLVQHTPQGVQARTAPDAQDLRTRGAREVSRDFFEAVGGRPLDEEEAALLDDVLTAIRSEATA